MTTLAIEHLRGSRRGSVLMEFVLVLPIYIAVMGGILWLGLRSLDAINLRSSDHWSVWSAGNRFQNRLPAAAALRGMFPRSTMVSCRVDRRLEDAHSYIQFIGGKTTIYQMRPGYIDNWLKMPYTVTGSAPPAWARIPETTMTSSRYGNKYTQCIIMRTKGSRTAKRNWHPSLIADKEIWKFTGKDSSYPKKWELKLLDSARWKDDGKEEVKEPSKIKFYERYGPYVDWSSSK